jgi:hypothetical protein
MSQTQKTVDAYRARAPALLKQASKELGRQLTFVSELILWFLHHHDTWRPSTIRQYRATLRQFVRDAMVTERLSPMMGEEMIKRLAGEKDEDGLQSAPRARRKSERPAKLKNLSPEIAEQLSARCGHYRTRTAKLAQAIVTAGPEIGLRDCEWQTIELGHDFVRVQNAKCTNDRANGTSRTIHLPPQHEAQELWAALNEIAIAVRADVPWATLRRRVNYVLKLSSYDIGLKRSASLGTFRHVAIARWKCVFRPDQVAALAGHGSNATAGDNYGRRRSGRKWPPVRVQPDPQNLACVEDRFYIRGQKRPPKRNSDVAPSSPSP